MRNVILVIKHEIASMLGKRSFWIMTFLFPLLILGLNIGVQVMSRRAFENDEIAARSDVSQVIGYVDPGGLIATIPDAVPVGLFHAYPDEAAAQTALEAAEIARYYIVPANWVETGDLVIVDRTFKPLGIVAGGEMFNYVLDYNMVGDAAVARLLLDPMPRVERHALAPQQGTDRDSPLAFWVPYATMFVFFFSLTVSSGLMLQSVAKEKETRAAEILLLSLRPRELMLGKMVGLGLVALFQLVIWASGGLLLLGRGEQLLGAAASFALPPGFVVWLLLYFVFGYAAYASALGAIGVLAPTAREGAQFTFIAMLPLMIPLWLNNVFAQDPNGELATFLSLFPPTAPLAMVTRLASGGVPLWQPVVGLLGLAAMAYVLVLLAARLFRADTLLSYASLNWRRIVSELRGT
jgi:ABC-2 type transport system permease protein